MDVQKMLFNCSKSLFFRLKECFFILLNKKTVYGCQKKCIFAQIFTVVL